MVMNAKQKGEEREVSSSANMQPSDVDLCKNQEKSFFEPDHPSDSETSHILEDKTVQSLKSKPKRSGVAGPLTELALLNKSIFVPPVTLQASENSHEGGTAVGLNKTQATACLSFQRVRQIPTSVEPKPDLSPPVVHRRRGRPRKNPGTPVGENEKHPVAEDTSKSVSESETSILDEERQSEKRTLEVTRAEDPPEVVSDNPVPVKRPRGRPPKKKSTQLRSPLIARAGRSASKSNKDSPVRPSRSFRSPDTKPKESPARTALLGARNASRPLTRGALGKDFPSAKKRSWIDIEKELEPELESE